VRLFVAVPLPAPLRERLAAQGRPLPGVRWVPDANLHLTVHFLSEVDEGDVPGLTRALADACRAQPAFELALQRMGPAPARRPRMVWAWIAPDPRLGALAEAVAAAAAPFAPAARPPRTQNPHVTLARLHGRAPHGLPDGPLDGRIRVGACELVQSRLGPGGAAYTTLVVLPLAGLG
jgi:RNA 2',3'-cyclic 3'-phosphodiesterase